MPLLTFSRVTCVAACQIRGQTTMTIKAKGLKKKERSGIAFLLSRTQCIIFSDQLNYSWLSDSHSLYTAVCLKGHFTLSNQDQLIVVLIFLV